MMNFWDYCGKCYFLLLTDKSRIMGEKQERYSLTVFDGYIIVSLMKHFVVQLIYCR